MGLGVLRWGGCSTFLIIIRVWWHKRWLVAVGHSLGHSGLALYPHKGLTNNKLIMGHFPWLNGLYLVDIIILVPPCVLAKALEIQFPLRTNKAD